MEAVHVLLNHLHRLEALLAGTTADLVLSRVISFILKMPHIGYVTHIPHIVAQVHQVPVEHVKSHRRTGVAEMGLAVDGGSADIHADKRWSQGFEQFLPACKGVV